MLNLKNCISELKNSLSRLSVSKSDFQSVIADIRKSNLRTLKAASVVLSILFLGLCLGVAKPGSYLSRNAIIYGYLTLSCLVIAVFCVTFLKRFVKLVIFFDYFFLFNCFIYGIIVGVFFQPNHFAASYNVIICLGPMLFIDKSWRIMGFESLFTFLFLYFSYHIKSDELFYMDAVNSLSFTLVAYGFCLYMNHMRVNDFILRQTIKHERDFDGLTAVLTKSAFKREISRKLMLTTEKGFFFIVDIDNFKSINDNFGHDCGDKVIHDISHIIKDTFRNTDLIGRFGGDEFVVYMSKTEDEAVAIQKAAMLVKTVNSKVKIGQEERPASVSIGGTSFDGLQASYDYLFKKADEALYKAKENGKNRFVFEK